MFRDVGVHVFRCFVCHPVGVVHGVDIQALELILGMGSELLDDSFRRWELADCLPEFRQEVSYDSRLRQIAASDDVVDGVGECRERFIVEVPRIQDGDDCLRDVP